MTASPVLEQTQHLTYAEYLAEGECFERYEIIDGVKYTMAPPTRRRQRILGHLYNALRQFEEAYGEGQAIMAPCDVLISQLPLRARQPGALFISNAQLALNGDQTEALPLFAAPELVCEIVSPSESRSLQEKKQKDYGRVGVKECWLLFPETQRVEILRLNSLGVESVAVYDASQTLQSLTFPALRVRVAVLFAP